MSAIWWNIWCGWELVDGWWIGGGLVVDLDSWAILIGREWTKFFEGDPKEKINRNGIFRKKPAGN